ncbi:RNA-directed DNA polymerase, eukaryota [Tanacetum coccineum]
MLNSSIGIFSFQFSSMDGLDAMLENDPWFIRNNPLILKKWNPDDGLSVAGTNLGTPLMLESYTSDMCIQSWGRSSYTRALIKVRIMMSVPVGPKVGFKPVKQVYRQVSKKNNVNTNGNKKKDVEPTIEVSNSNLFDVLNSVENDVDLGTNVRMKLHQLDMTNFPSLKKVGYGTNSLLEQWKESYVNGDYDFDPYDDDMYEGQGIPNKIQDI